MRASWAGRVLMAAALLVGCALSDASNGAAQAQAPAAPPAAPQGSVPVQPSAQAAGCTYVLGFLALYQLLPQVMGACAANEVPAPNGDSLQRTVNGLAVYRRADNWTAFTDGARTWI